MAKYNFNFADLKTTALLTTTWYSLAKTLPVNGFISAPLGLMMTMMLADYWKDQSLHSAPDSRPRATDMSVFNKADLFNTERRHTLFHAVSAGGAKAFDTMTHELFTRTPKAIQQIRSSRP
ncbi:MAG: hypothetical protein P1U34_06695 [Coxiellaceae bacterium]|nr:hypothetical protein [Coxiellaceae bacterium]